MSTFTFRIDSMRVVSLEYVKAFFNIAFGVEDDGDFTPLFVVRDFALKPTKAGGLWIQPPGKLRKDKNGEKVMDGQYPKYDNYFDYPLIDGAGKDGGKGISKASWALKTSLLEAAVAMYESLAETPQNTARRTKAAAKAGTSVREEEPGTPTGDSEETWW